MKAFVILLQRDEKRNYHVYNNLVPELSKQCQVEVFNAIDVKNQEQFVNALQRNKILFSKPMQAGAYGCYLSHYEVWKKIAEGEDEMALILEDDAVASEWFQNHFNELVQEIPKDSDITYIYTCPVQRKKQEEMVRVEGKKFLVEPYYTWCLLSYIMPKKTAQYLIQNMKVAELPVDDELCKNYWHKMKIHLTSENFFYSIGQTSINENAEAVGKFKSNIHGTPFLQINYN